jgi:hypothetical protein
MRFVTRVNKLEIKKNLSGPVSRVLFFQAKFPKEAIISLR